MRNVKYRFWRTLVRVVAVHENSIDVVIPGWNSEQIINLPSFKIVDWLMERAEPGYRFHCSTNKGVNKVEDLEFCNFEWPNEEFPPTYPREPYGKTIYGDELEGYMEGDQKFWKRNSVAIDWFFDNKEELERLWNARKK